VTPDALRFLGRAGLLPDASHEADATPEYRARLRFIERARALGFPLHEVRELLLINDSAIHDTTALRASIARQLEGVEERIIALMRVRQALLLSQESPGRHGGREPIAAALQDESRD
jgi:MerR family mercuric resistance operon transcriptional regulator